MGKITEYSINQNRFRLIRDLQVVEEVGCQDYWKHHVGQFFAAPEIGTSCSQIHKKLQKAVFKNFCC